MRAEAIKKKLDRIKDKYKRTSVEGFRERGTLVQETPHFYLTKNEFPHMDRERPQYILRAKYRKRYEHTFWDECLESLELKSLINEYKEDGYQLTESEPHLKSVPERLHIHIHK